MNWYKIIKFCQRVLEKPVTYLDIGHDMTNQKGEPVSPNYMWLYYDGEILTEEETLKNQIHEQSFSFIEYSDWGKYYTGRYESSTGRLSLLKPNQGVSAHRDISNSLMSKLYNKFPDITLINTF